MFSFGTISDPAFAVTRGMPRVRVRRRDTELQSDRRVSSMENANSWPISAAGVGLTIAKDRPRREEPWRRRLSGAGFIPGLALQGSVLPVGL